MNCARLWAGRLPHPTPPRPPSLPRLVRKRGSPTSHWSPATHAQARTSFGRLSAQGFCGLPWRRTVGRDSRTAPCRTGPGVQGLISAGSWRPVPARAPQPNSMAIVRRPLCSGGGHFLQDRAGGGLQETRIRRPAWPGVLSRGLVSVRGLLGGWESRNVSWRSGGGGWVREITAYRAGGGAEEGPQTAMPLPGLLPPTDPGRGVTGSEKLRTAVLDGTQTSGGGNSTPPASPAGIIHWDSTEKGAVAWTVSPLVAHSPEHCGDHWAGRGPDCSSLEDPHLAKSQLCGRGKAALWSTVHRGPYPAAHD